MNEITPDMYKNFTPLPEDVQGWQGDRPIFAKLIDQIRPRHIIEVGTWKGMSAITMGEHLVKRGWDTECKITCVDTWLGAVEFWTTYAHTPERDLMLKHGYPQVYYQFLSNVVHRGLQHVIQPLPLPSNIAAKVLQSKAALADLIYIDGSHEADDVSADCTSYWRLLHNGGVMFGDDWSWPGLAPAVSAFARWHGVKVAVEEDFWVITK